MQSCPATGKECHNCGKRGHFAKYCKSAKQEVKNITKVQESTSNFLQDSGDDSCFSLTGEPGKSPETQIAVGQMEVRVLIDSGASVNIIHQNIFKQLQKRDNTIKLLPTKAKICAYGSADPIELAGQFTTTIQSTMGQSTQATFYVTKGQYKCILGFQSSTQLGLITLNVNSMAAEHENPTVEKNSPTTSTAFSRNWQFEGSGNHTSD